MLILLEGIFNANVYKTGALKWLCYWLMLCLLERVGQSYNKYVERSESAL